MIVIFLIFYENLIIYNILIFYDLSLSLWFQGKAKKKKPCTRPVPFNLSQPKRSRTTSKNQQPLTVPQTQSGTNAVQSENSVCSVRLKTQNINSKPTKHPGVVNSHVSSAHKSHGKATENISHQSGQSGLPNTLKTFDTLPSPPSAIPDNTLHQSNDPSSAQPALSAETCLENMNLLSLKDLTKTSNASQSTQVNISKGSTGKLRVLLIWLCFCLAPGI